LERQTDFGREFRGEALMPTGVEAVSQMGLGSQLDALPHTMIAAILVYVQKRGPFRLADDDDDADLGIRMVSQPLMLEMLVEQAARFPSFRLERGTTVRDLVYAGERIVGLKADTQGGSREIHAELVIGADGRASVLRKRSGLHEERFPQAFDVIWGKVPLPPFMNDRRTARAYLNRHNAALAFPAADGRMQFGWLIEKGTFGDLRSRGVDAWFAQMAKEMPPDMAGHLLANKSSITHPFLLDVICDRLVRWTAPGLLLLGDAAHPMSPVGGQGINMALRDAIVAANHLLPVLERGGGPERIDAATQRIQEERLPEIEQIQREQQSFPAVIFGTTWRARFVRALVTPLLAYPAIAQRGFRQIRERFAHGVTQVALRV
jgi:2-polyprenyl-6-methoxyphenol hydroxylase-like FAD-dependent oxidoreductase